MSLCHYVINDTFFKGSLNSIWLMDQHVEHCNEKRTLKTCVRNSSDCCATNAMGIKVKKCCKNEEEYFVYYLSPTSMRYCAGKFTCFFLI